MITTWDEENQLERHNVHCFVHVYVINNGKGNQYVREHL